MESMSLLKTEVIKNINKIEDELFLESKLLASINSINKDELILKYGRIVREIKQFKEWVKEM
jgi:hypothetical protein